MLASSVPAWRGDPAIFFTLGDISLLHNWREEGGGFIVDENISEVHGIQIHRV